jgi:hypothetical protein
MRTISEILKKTKYTENQLEYFLAECYTDYIYFAEHVLGFEIAAYHKEWYALAEKFKRLCIIAFRGSGKTCFFAGYYIWKSIFQGPREILIVSHREEQAKKVLKIVRDMIVNNEILSQFVPTLREITWKATEIELMNKSLFLCKPYNESIRTWHPDDILLDEIGEYEDKSVFWTAVLGAIQIKMGNIIGIGTPKSAVDLLAELKENEEYFCKEYPAEIDGQPLWSAKYTNLPHDLETKRSLKKIRKEMGELPYAQEYMLIPISSANSLFPYELTSKGLANDEEFYPYGKKQEKYYIGYDVAISPKGDWTVMTVLGVNVNRKRIVKALRFREDFNYQKERLRELFNDFSPIKVLIDATGLGEQQAKELSQEFSNVEPLKITYDEKYKMLLDLRQEFERFNMIIPNSKNHMATYSHAQQLLKELNDFAIKMDLRPGSLNASDGYITLNILREPICKSK